MELDSLAAHMLSLPGAVEDRPFGLDVPVYKVMGKMFAYLLPSRIPPWLTLKLAPAMGQLARSTHPAVRPGYHMNKDHWNTIVLDGSVPEAEILAWIDESYELVVGNLPRRLKRALADEHV